MNEQIDLTKLTQTELNELRRDIEKQEQTNQRNARSKAMNAVAAAAAEHGFKLTDLFPNSPSARTRTAQQAKYRDPENPENTWTGRGRQPSWFRERLKHIDRSAMLIPESETA